MSGIHVQPNVTELRNRIIALENETIKRSYYQVVSSTSGSIPVSAGINLVAGQFGSSGNSILSQVDGSMYPLDDSPTDISGNPVTSTLNVTTGAWVASASYIQSYAAIFFVVTGLVKDVNLFEIAYPSYVPLDDLGLEYTAGTGVTIVNHVISAINNGTVTSVSVVSANGITGVVANPTTTPAITLTLESITPATVNGLTLAAQSVGFTIVGGTTSKTLTVSNTANVSGTNTGDQNLSGYALIGQTMYIGTTAVAINRASGALALTGITSIDGNAATVTNGVYTSGSYADPAWITSLSWSKLTGTPTTVSGYGITDVYTKTAGDVRYLQNVSGTTNRITVTGAAIVDISASYVGQASITTLGTIGTGTWQGAAITDAYIASAATWNAKQNALTFGNLTENTSSVLTLTGNTGAIIGSGLTIEVKLATTSQSGYLSSADWNIFNGKVSSQWITTGSDIYYNTGAVGIGAVFTTATATAVMGKLHTVETSTTAGIARGAIHDQYSSTGSSQLNMRTASGTFASGTASGATTIATGRIISNLNSWGHDGTSFVNAAAIRVTAVGTIGTGRVPTNMMLMTMTDATTGVLTTALTLDQSQNAAFAASVSYVGSLTTGTLGYTDTGIFSAFQASSNSYQQSILRNSNAGAAASTDIIVNNNQSTASTFYGDFGINSSAFTGAGSLNLANAIYLTATSGDLVLGTTTSNAIRLVVNSGATDALVIGTSGVITTGTWNGTILDPTYGGTGINNGSKTITLGGNLSTTGAFNLTLSVPRTTTYTLPNTASETLAGLGTAQTFSAVQTVATTTNQHQVSIQTNVTNSLTSIVKGLELSRNPSATAIGNLGGIALSYSLTNSANTLIDSAVQISGAWLSNTNTTERSAVQFSTMNAGSLTVRGYIARVVGASSSDLFLGTSTPSTTNYVLCNDSTNVLLNNPSSTGNINFNFAGTNNASVNRKGLTLSPATLADTEVALSLTVTMPTTITATNNAVSFSITSAGSSSQTNRAMVISYVAGYTGSSQTSGLTVLNQAAGTGTGFNIAASAGNFGLSAGASATTTGTNVGGVYSANGGNINIGVSAKALTAKNSATNIGGAFFGNNSGTSPIHIGVYAGLNTTDPTFVSAALLVDNSSATDPIAIFRDNGTVVLTIADGGTTTLLADFKLGAAGNGIYIKEGSNATMGIATLVLGVATVSTTKVTANSRIFLSVESLGTIASPVAIAVTARSAGTSFTITSANLTDTSVISWIIIEPS